MSKEESNSYSPAEQYVADTVSRMQKSVHTTMMVAAVILTIEIAYFSILNNKIAEGLTAIPDMVEAYQDDFNKINDMAGKFRRLARTPTRLPRRKLSWTALTALRAPQMLLVGSLG